MTATRAEIINISSAAKKRSGDKLLLFSVIFLSVLGVVFV